MGFPHSALVSFPLLVPEKQCLGLHVFWEGECAFTIQSGIKCTILTQFMFWFCFFEHWNDEPKDTTAFRHTLGPVYLRPLHLMSNDYVMCWAGLLSCKRPIARVIWCPFPVCLPRGRLFPFQAFSPAVVLMKAPLGKQHVALSSLWCSRSAFGLVKETAGISTCQQGWNNLY